MNEGTITEAFTYRSIDSIYVNYLPERTKSTTRKLFQRHTCLIRVSLEIKNNL